MSGSKLAHYNECELKHPSWVRADTLELFFRGRICSNTLVIVTRLGVWGIDPVMNRGGMHGQAVRSSSAAASALYVDSLATSDCGASSVPPPGHTADMVLFLVAKVKKPETPPLPKIPN
eukprot:157386-Amphidinium_carterae.1